MKMRKTLLSALALASVLFALASQELAAQTERDISFSQKLNEIQMYDYSEYFLKKRIDLKPEDVDKLKAQLAETYMQWNKPAEAEKIIAGVPESSPFYANCQAVLGVAAAKKGKYDMAVKPLEKVFEHCKRNKEAAKEFKEALFYLQHVYKETEQPEKIKPLNALLFEGQDPREVLYYSIVAELDTAQNMLDEEKASPDKAKPFADNRKKRLDAFEKRDSLKRDKKKNAAALELLTKVDMNDWQSIALRALYELEEIQWGGQDIVTAFAYSAAARANYIMGAYDEGLKELDKSPELLEACDEEFKKNKAIGQSPGALAKYWAANIHLVKAETAKDSEQKVKSLKGAFLNYGRLLKNYPGFPDAGKAYSKFLKVCDDLSAAEPKLAPKITAERDTVPAPAAGASDTKEENIVPAKAEQLFKDKRYAEAVKELLPLVQQKRLSGGVPEAIHMLSFSMVNNSQELEAMAMAKYLATMFPKSQFTPVALLQVGEILWKGGKNEDAINLYEAFLKTSPDYQCACEIAMRVAQDYYNKAVEAANVANKMPQGEEKRQKTAEAIEMFKVAIPKFQRIIASYGNRKEWVDKAYYMLAISFYSSRQFEEASDTYIKFCNSDPEDKIQTADAKLRAADSLYQAGLACDKQAKDLKEAAYAMPKSDEKAPAATDAPKAPEAAKSPDSQTPAAAAPATAPAPAAPAAATEKKDEEQEQPNIGEAEAAAAIAQGAPPPADPNSREGKLYEAAKLERAAKDRYKEGVANLKELLDEWLKDGGKLAAIANEAKVRKIAEDSSHLLAWLYDSAGEKQAACAEFQKFIDKYPKSANIPACMMRMGVIYTELNDDKNAEKILSDLSSKYKDTNEGKNAKFYLARSLYNNQKFEKCVEIVNELFTKKDLFDNLTVANLRWIASNMVNCGGKHPKDAALMALKAAETLIAKLEKPELKDWVGPQRASELLRNDAELKKTVAILKQKAFFDAASAAYWSEDYVKSIGFYDQVLKDENTPYFYDVKFGRADAYLKKKDLEGARGDLSDAALRANTSGKYSLYDKAQCLIGDIYIEEKNYAKAFACFNIVAAPAFMDEGAPERPLSAAEKLEAEKDAAAAKEWIEYAIYRTAFCAAKLNKPDDKAKMVDKYKKNFPDGRFVKEMASLPPPEADNKP